jgi:hypothetical protein
MQIHLCYRRIDGSKVPVHGRVVYGMAGWMYHCILVQGGSQESGDVQICVLLSGLLGRIPGVGRGVQGAWLARGCVCDNWGWGYIEG